MSFDEDASFRADFTRVSPSLHIVQDNSFSAYLKQEAGSLTKVTASHWPMGTAEGHSELFYSRVSLAE